MNDRELPELVFTQQANLRDVFHAEFFDLLQQEDQQ